MKKINSNLSLRLIDAPSWPPLTRGLSAELTGGEKIVDNSCFSLPPALRATSLVRGRLWGTANLKEYDKSEFDSDLTGNPLWGKIYDIGGMQHGIQMESESTL